MSALRPPECVVGDNALARGAWEQARNAFEAALRSREFPEALEGLGTAAWWLNLADLVFDSRERADRLYVERGDYSDAARVAVWLAWDYWAFRGEGVVANGWLGRARRLLKGQPDDRNSRRFLHRILPHRDRAEAGAYHSGAGSGEVGNSSPMLPTGAQIAVLAGDPAKPVSYTIRLRFPANYAIPAHSHPTDEHVVVVSGALTFGMGDRLVNGSADNKTLPSGGFALMPAHRNHYVYTGDQETTIVLYGQGPVEFKYVNPADDPRTGHKGTQ